MSRRMSCSMTVPQVRSLSKTVTRRHVGTWLTLRAGDRVTLIEKGMGLAKGESQVEIVDVEIVDVRVELLGDLTEAECAAEGFPDMSLFEFASMWAASHGYERSVRNGLLELFDVPCRRIEFRYLDEVAPT